MLGKANGGGVVAFLNVNCPHSSTITVKNGNITRTATGTSVSFKLQRIGNWTITATYGSITETRTVSMSAGQTRTETMLNSLYAYNHGSYASWFSRGWSTSSGDSDRGGEASTYVYAYGSAANVIGYTTTSNGSVNLTGFRTVQLTFNGWAALFPDSDWGGEYSLRILNASTNAVLWTQTYYAPSSQSNATISVNVSNINVPVKFSIEGKTQGNIQLVAIRLIA